MRTTRYRLRITDKFNDARTYITSDENHGISYFGANETSLALSNLLSGDAAETRFALEDAETGADAAKILTIVLKRQWRGNPTKCPTVEKLA